MDATVVLFAVAAAVVGLAGSLWSASRQRRAALERAPTRTGPPRLFVSYRRDDAQGEAGRLYDGLAPWFGPTNVFMDVDSVPFGWDFVEAMLTAVRAADVVLVVIGRTWLTSPDAGGHRRIDDPADNVRLEVETALRTGKRVIPVLVGGAAMPHSGALPPSLAPLARLNAFTLTHGTFRDDVRRLATALEGP